MKNQILSIDGVKKLQKEELYNVLGGNSSRCPIPQNPGECAAAGGYWFGTGCLYAVNYCNQ